MQGLLDSFSNLVAGLNGVLWHPAMTYVLLAVGILFTIWGRFSQVRAITQGTASVLGRFDDAKAPGAISHFQALSAALSATVGLGNIGGVALAVALGGPGSVFWMWVVGFLGMALKTTEVTLSMIYRNTQDPDNPHGGPMWVIRNGLAQRFPQWAGLGKTVGGVFCVTLLISTLTGGNMFQAWNVGNIMQEYFGVPSIWVGCLLAVLVGGVILGGIHRIGAVAGRLVPLMCAAYLVAGVYVIISRIDQVPAVFGMIFRCAFDSTQAEGAFVGGTVGLAFAIGLQRAFFSSEAGQGSSPIAHSAVRTDEPAREGLVAGLEPLIDTLVICTMTALVIFLSGVWNRSPDQQFLVAPQLVQEAEGPWTLEGGLLGDRPDRPWQAGDTLQVHLTDLQGTYVINGNLESVTGEPGSVSGAKGDMLSLRWTSVSAVGRPELKPGFFIGYTAAAFTALAFDRVHPGLGKWLITAATWLFAISTLISWSYYGEQGIVYLVGESWVSRYRWIFCGCIVLACSGIVRTINELNQLTLLGTGFMLWANIPITLLFAREAMAVQEDYRRRQGEQLEVAADDGGLEVGLR